MPFENGWKQSFQSHSRHKISARLLIEQVVAFCGKPKIYARNPTVFETWSMHFCSHTSHSTSRVAVATCR